MIPFAPGSYRLDANDVSTIEGVIQDWRAQPGKKIVVAAGADKSGSAARNRQLARQRGEAIRTALLRRGVPAGAIRVELIEDSRLAVIELTDESTCG